MLTRGYARRQPTDKVLLCSAVKLLNRNSGRIRSRCKFAKRVRSPK